MYSTTESELRPRAISIGGWRSESPTPRSFSPLSQVETRDSGPGSWFDNFRRANNPSPESFNTTTGVYNERRAAVRTTRTALARNLKSRHLQFLAIGGSIGIWLRPYIQTAGTRAEKSVCRHRFVDRVRQCPRDGRARLNSHRLYHPRCGLVLYHAGDGGDGKSLTPAVGHENREMQNGLTCRFLSPQASLFPIAGSFAAFGTRFIDPAWGFAMGWKYVVSSHLDPLPTRLTCACCSYAVNWLIILPLEIIAALHILEYWKASLPLSQPVLVTVLLVSVFSINLCGVRAFGEAEFVASVVKAAAVIGFM